MAVYTTPLPRSIPIIDDRNARDFARDVIVEGGLKTRGYIPRDWAREPYGSIAKPLDIPIIPRDEWRDRIEEMDRTKTRLSDLLDQAGVKVKDQNGTNYCWINAPVHCVEIIRAVQGMEYVSLSPASVGSKIKNFRNVGGWGSEGLRYLVDHGAVPSEDWPDNAIDRRYDTQENNALRAKYQVDEWYDVVDVHYPGRERFEKLMTCLLLRIPVAIGLNWWGHEVTAIDPVALADGFGSLIDNSWGTGWGERGRSVLAESKATPDDAVAPRVVTAA